MLPSRGEKPLDNAFVAKYLARYESIIYHPQRGR